MVLIFRAEYICCALFTTVWQHTTRVDSEAWWCGLVLVLVNSITSDFCGAGVIANYTIIGVDFPPWYVLEGFVQLGA